MDPRAGGGWPRQRHSPMRCRICSSIGASHGTACFDYLIMKIRRVVPYTYQGTHDTYLKYPPAPLSSIPPYSCHIWPSHRAPWHCAHAVGVRISALLVGAPGQLTRPCKGRMGWNCVTGCMAPLRTMAETSNTLTMNDTTSPMSSPSSHAVVGGMGEMHCP